MTGHQLLIFLLRCLTDFEPLIQNASKKFCNTEFPIHEQMRFLLFWNSTTLYLLYVYS
jgi:hypothetical protein